MTVLYLIILAILSGVLGRMGGAGKSGQWYDFLLDTKWRDVGCSLLIIFTWILLFGFSITHWWVYLIMLGLHWAAFSTYWDWVFKKDNLWVAGFFVGLASLPMIIIIDWIWWFIIIRAVVLAIIWGLLNKYLPSQVLVWRRDVAEEFLRYKSVII